MIIACLGHACSGVCLTCIFTFHTYSIPFNKCERESDKEDFTIISSGTNKKMDVGEFDCPLSVILGRFKATGRGGIQMKVWSQACTCQLFTFLSSAFAVRGRLALLISAVYIF